MLVCKSRPALGLQEPALQGLRHTVVPSPDDFMPSQLLVRSRLGIRSQPLKSHDHLVENVLGGGLGLAGIRRAGAIWLHGTSELYHLAILILEVYTFLLGPRC